MLLSLRENRGSQGVRGYLRILGNCFVGLVKNTVRTLGSQTGKPVRLAKEMIAFGRPNRH